MIILFLTLLSILAYCYFKINKLCFISKTQHPESLILRFSSDTEHSIDSVSFRVAQYNLHTIYKEIS